MTGTGSPTAALERVRFLDCPIDPATMSETVARCLEWCRKPRRSHVLLTVNAALLVAMRRDSRLREAALASDFTVADGMAVVWGCRLTGHRLPERVAGVDLMGELLSAADQEGRSAYFLGARPEVVRKLVDLVGKRHPGLRVAGFRDGYFPPEQAAQIALEIAASKADLLFVGMPSPFKECWCAEHREALSTPVILGVGGSFDVHAGFVRRAPRFMQRVGLEWFWRLLMEPRKMWKRYLVTNSLFLFAVAGSVLGRRGRGAHD